MALRFVSKTVEPVTLELAMRYRDMQSVNNERPLMAMRAKTHVALIGLGDFNGMDWGECELNGVTYRGNGNHSSHVLTACIQAHAGGLDAKSEEFFKKHLAKGRGPWKGETPTDLPEVKSGQLVASIEKYAADSQEDLIKFFRRYDAAMSARRASDVINVYAGEHECLRRLPTRLINKAVLGVAATIKDDPEVAGLEPNYQVPMGSGEIGILLRDPDLLDCVRWMVEEITDSTLYGSTESAIVCVEAYFNHGAEKAAAILMEILRQADSEDDSPGAAFYALLTRKRPRPTRASIMAKGRKAIKSIADGLKVAVAV